MENKLIEEILNRVSSELVGKLEGYLIEGLKLKGFEFTNKIELEAFVKTRCKCIDNQQKEEKIYFVDDI